VGVSTHRPGAGHTARRRGARPSTAARGAAARVAVGLAVLGVLALSAGGCTADPAGRAKPTPEASYGDLPTFLPSSAVRPNGVLIGTADHPALTSQGDAVNAQFAGTSVLATVTGPQVPGDGLPYQTHATTCTWTITLSEARSNVPITISDFSTLDHFGKVYHPALIPGQVAPPAVLRPGKTVTFDLRTVMAVGEGLMRWAPGGKQNVASWDFVVEND